MDTISLLIVVAACVCAQCMMDVIRHVLKKRSRPSPDVRRAVDEAIASEPEPDNAEPAPDGDKARQDATESTRRIITDSLIAIGCQPEEREDGEIVVKYQGENFVIRCSGRLARIWDYGWYSIKNDDPKREVLIPAVNRSNYHTGNVIVLAHDEDRTNIWLHTIDTIMLHPACPENVEYLRSVFDNFFATKSHFGEVYREIIGVYEGASERHDDSVVSTFKAPSPN